MLMYVEMDFNLVQLDCTGILNSQRYMCSVDYFYKSQTKF